VTSLADKLATLSTEQRQLLERKLRARKAQGASAEAPAIVRRPMTGLRPLSLDQERLWFLARFAPDNAAYNINTGTWLRGNLDVGALERSINAVIQRHESLRTTIVEEHGAPRQRVAERVILRLERLDLHDLPVAQRQGEIERQAAAFAARRFDLENGPLVRYLLMQLGLREHVLVSTMHHITMDWWSSQIIFDEITACYNAFSRGADPLLPEPPFQFSDFVVWERDFLARGLLEPSLAYWRNKLAGGTFSLDLPIARSRPTAPRFQGRRQWLEIASPLIVALRDLARRENTTLFTVLTAAYKTLLFRYTGQTDITLGAPLADRTREEWQQVVGFMITMLVYHTELDGDLPFRELLARVRATILEAYTHKDVPFSELVEIAKVERDWHRNPLFQHSFIFLNLAEWHNSGGNDFEALDIEHIDYDPEVSRFDTTLTIWEVGDSFRAYIEYDSDLYRETDMARFADHYRNLLTAIAAQPDLPIGRLDMLGAAERSGIVEARNQTCRDYPRESIAALFAAQAARTPSATAACFHDGELSYAALERRANRLAHVMIGRGLMPGAPVAVLLDAGLDMVVAILAVLKAGGVYVPLNPDQPADRLTFILRDTGTALLLSTAALAERLPAWDGAVLCLDSERSTVGDAEDSAPAIATAADDPAYIVYTSGSTGQPKGIVIPQRGVVRLVFNTNYIEFRCGDRVAQANNFAFDATTFELWGALLHGGTLVQIERADLLAPASLAALIREQAIDVMLLTTAVFNHLAQACPDAFAPLRYLLFGGETASAASVRAVLAAGAPRHFIHAYGPSESTVIATAHEIHAVADDATTISIGQPIANTTTYILNAQGEPVADGIAGELCIGGDGLALGYLNRPDLERQRFIPDPFSNSPGARLYRSGDWVRAGADGAIEFIGRTDNQVKIRGFRIEPDEVNHCLSQHPAVSDSIVIVAEAPGLGRHMVAYAVVDGDTDGTELKRYLAARLPAYMLPAAVMILDRLPLNTNGKIDRRALPDVAAALQSMAAADYSPPTTPTEQRLAAIWADILERPRIGIHDNFFELGGHSLLAVRLSTAVEKSFGQSLPVAALFRYPTVAGLAQYLDTEQPSSWSPVVALQILGEQPPLLCVPGAGGHPYYLWELAQALGEGQPFYGLQPPGAEGDAEPLHTMDALVTFFLDALNQTGFKPPFYLAGHSSGGHIALALALALEQRGHAVPGLVLLDVEAPGQVAEYHFAEADISFEDWETLGALVPHVQSVKQRLGERLPLSLDTLAGLGGEAALQYVSEAYRTAKILPPDAGIDQIRRMTEISSCTMRAVRAFRPAAQYQGRALLLRAEAGESDSGDRMARGWQAHCARSVEIHSIPGNHLTMLNSPHVRMPAARIVAFLER
jgi:amino acid adenylation domain-containing protein